MQNAHYVVQMTTRLGSLAQARAAYGEAMAGHVARVEGTVSRARTGRPEPNEKRDHRAPAAARLGVTRVACPGRRQLAAGLGVAAALGVDSATGLAPADSVGLAPRFTGAVPVLVV